MGLVVPGTPAAASGAAPSCPGAALPPGAAAGTLATTDKCPAVRLIISPPCTPWQPQATPHTPHAGLQRRPGSLGPNRRTARGARTGGNYSTGHGVKRNPLKSAGQLRGRSSRVSLEETAQRPIVCALGLGRKQAAREFSVSPVVGDTLAATPLARAGFICARACVPVLPQVALQLRHPVHLRLIPDELRASRFGARPAARGDHGAAPVALPFSAGSGTGGRLRPEPGSPVPPYAPARAPVQPGRSPPPANPRREPPPPG